MEHYLEKSSPRENVFLGVQWSLCVVVFRMLALRIAREAGFGEEIRFIEIATRI